MSLSYPVVIGLFKSHNFKLMKVEIVVIGEKASTFPPRRLFFFFLSFLSCRNFFCRCQKYIAGHVILVGMCQIAASRPFWHVRNANLMTATASERRPSSPDGLDANKGHSCQDTSKDNGNRNLICPNGTKSCRQAANSIFVSAQIAVNDRWKDKLINTTKDERGEEEKNSFLFFLSSLGPL